MTSDPSAQPPEADDRLPARYQDAQLVGAGTFGRVYRATDPTHGTVALKVLDLSYAGDPAAQWAFLEEFRQLSRLAHSGLPRGLEEGRTPAGAPFFAMTWVDGDAPATGVSLAPGAVRTVMVGVSRALAYLHALGVVHGDLKSENVKLGPDGVVSLLDLGLAARVGQRREAVRGTPAYLAPEAFRRHDYGPGADLYALGVLAYELRTGHLPFTGSPAALVAGHLRELPPAMVTAAPDAALDALILSLLAKEPSGRPDSALVVLAALGDGDAPAVRQRGLDSGAFVGRALTSTAWSEALAVRDGARWVTLEGEHGSGKSRAIDECRLAALEADRTWVGAACAGSAEAPAGPLRAVLAQALGAAGLLPSDLVAGWLNGRVPEKLGALEPMSVRAALQLAAGEALVRAAIDLGGLAIGLDDWHLADPATRVALEHFRHATVTAPIAWVLAGEPAAASNAAGISGVTGTSVVLAPLDPAEVAALVTSRLGAEPPATVLEALGAANGNPGAVVGLLEEAVAAGVLVGSQAGWRYTPGAATRGTSRLTAAWSTRVTLLDPAARALAALLALAHRAGWLGPWDLGPVLELEPVAVAAAANDLLGAGIAIMADRRLRLAPGVAADAALEGVAQELRARWANALARRLAPDAMTGPLDGLLGAAWLALEGSDDNLAISLTAAAARRCVALGTAGLALSLAEVAAGRSASALATADGLVLAVAAADALRLLDRPADSIAGYERALELPVAEANPIATASAMIGLAKCRQLRGDYAGAGQVLAQAVDFARHANLRDLACRAAIAQARLRLFENDVEGAMVACEAAVADARSHGHAALLAQALNQHGALMVQRDPAAAVAGLTLIHQAIALGEEAGDRLGVAFMLDNLGNAYMDVGELGGAAEAFARYAARCEELGAQTELLSARLNQARVAADLGSSALAVQWATEAGRRAERAGRRMVQGLALGVESQAHWRRGQFGDAFARLDEALAIATSLRNAYMEGHLRLYRLGALLALGDHRLARAEAAVAREVIGTQPELSRHLAAAEAALALLAGQPAEARRLALPLAALPVRALAARARTILAEAALALGEPSVARAEAEAMRELVAPWQAPWHSAAAAALGARASAADGDAAGARALAYEALELAFAEDANPFAAGQAAAVLAVFPLPADASPIARGADAARGVLSGVAPEHRPGLVAAWGLGALGKRLEGPAEPTKGSSTVDPVAVAGWLGRVADAADEASIGTIVMQAAMELVQGQRGYLLAFKEGRLGRVLAHGLDYSTEVKDGFSLSIAREAMFSATPIYVLDAGADPRWNSTASVMSLGLRTVLALPLATPDEILGVLYMDRPDPEPMLGDADLAMLMALMRVASNGIARDRAFRAAREEVDGLAASAALGARLTLARPEERAAIALAAWAEVVGADRVLRILPDDGDGWRSPDTGTDGSLPEVSLGIVNWVAQQRQPLGLLDAGLDEDWGSRGSVQALGLRSIWCLPVPEGEGVIYLDANSAGGDIGPAALGRLQALIDYAWPLVATLRQQ